MYSTIRNIAIIAITALLLLSCREPVPQETPSSQPIVREISVMANHLVDSLPSYRRQVVSNSLRMDGTGYWHNFVTSLQEKLTNVNEWNVNGNFTRFFQEEVWEQSRDDVITNAFEGYQRSILKSRYYNPHVLFISFVDLIWAKGMRDQVNHLANDIRNDPTILMDMWGIIDTTLQTIVDAQRDYFVSQKANRLSLPVVFWQLREDDMRPSDTGANLSNLIAHTFCELNPEKTVVIQDRNIYDSLIVAYQNHLQSPKFDQQVLTSAGSGRKPWVSVGGSYKKLPDNRYEITLWLHDIINSVAINGQPERMVIKLQYGSTQIHNPDELAAQLVGQLHRTGQESVYLRPFSCQNLGSSSEFAVFFQGILSGAFTNANWSMVSLGTDLDRENLSLLQAMGGTHEFTGNIWDSGNSWTFIASLRQVYGGITHTTSATIKKTALDGFPPITTPYHNAVIENYYILETNKLPNISPTPAHSGNWLSLDAWTDKGVNDLVYTEGEEITFFLRANKPCWIRIIDFLPLDGQLVPTLTLENLQLEQGNNNYRIPQQEVGGFPIEGPFGPEILQILAQDTPFEPIDFEWQIIGDTRYRVINNYERKVRMWRGVAPLDEDEIIAEPIQEGPSTHKAERIIKITTVPNL
ncbi:MAG: hypothetical protein P9M15_06330 [Candidatus Electryoneaceae bacterium]|nr:hypothetical protein [Candidatus Electryoneaceae bacterium]